MQQGGVGAGLHRLQGEVEAQVGLPLGLQPLHALLRARVRPEGERHRGQALRECLLNGAIQEAAGSGGVKGRLVDTGRVTGMTGGNEAVRGLGQVLQHGGNVVLTVSACAKARRTVALSKGGRRTLKPR